VRGRLLWTEWIEDEATPHDASSVVWQQVLSGDAKDDERPHQNLRTTEPEPQGPPLGHVNRVLAPVSAMLKRDCDLMEAHTLDALFCRHCGDFFAGSDSL